MDLDEFLTETGLVDEHFAGILSGTTGGDPSLAQNSPQQNNVGKSTKPQVGLIGLSQFSSCSLQGAICDIWVCCCLDLRPHFSYLDSAAYFQSTNRFLTLIGLSSFQM